MEACPVIWDTWGMSEAKMPEPARTCKKVNIYNMYQSEMTKSECATKRIPVCPSTWASIHQLRMPGQTYDDVIRELIRTNSDTKLIEETDRICKRGHFVEYKL